ncbi:hypothetical protein TrVE_jg5989 [Triparma verrucosa]|uniref:Uncharacterized protein n=1 Tax=Triparma verrucosa TaxID=1606542 RepID=A0A9W7EUN7_9STRA|nr:hypothetical protein TrVE_jg5989 [Triparma verrucosa]
MKPFSKKPSRNARKPKSAPSRKMVISDAEAYNLAVEITHDILSDDDLGQEDFSGDQEDKLFKFIEGDEKAEDVSMLEVVWEGEGARGEGALNGDKAARVGGPSSDQYAPAHLKNSSRDDRLKKEAKILRLAKAKIWSEKVRAKNASARAKAEVKSIQFLNAHLRGAGGARNGPIVAVLEKEENRLKGMHKEKVKEAKKADKVFVKEMIKTHSEFGVELKLRKKAGRRRKKKAEGESSKEKEEEEAESEEDTAIEELALGEGEAELSPPPSLDRSVDAGAVAWGEGGLSEQPPSTTTTSGASAFADDDEGDVEGGGEEGVGYGAKPDTKEDAQEVNIKSCGFFKPTKSVINGSPRPEKAPKSPAAKSLTRTKSGQRRLKTAKEVLGPPNFSPRRSKQSVSALEAQLTAEIEEKRSARLARGKLAMMEQDAKRRKRRLQQQEKKRIEEERRQASLKKLEEEVFQACVRGMKRGERATERKTDVDVKKAVEEENIEEVEEVVEDFVADSDTDSSPASSPTTEEKKDFQSSPAQESRILPTSTAQAAAAAYRMKRERRVGLNIVKKPTKPLVAGATRGKKKSTAIATANTKATESLIEKLQDLTIDLNRINSKVSEAAGGDSSVRLKKKKKSPKAGGRGASTSKSPKNRVSPKNKASPKNKVSASANKWDDLISDSSSPTNTSLSDIKITNSMRAKIREKRF